MSYASKVADLGATAYYRLGEASGTTINDEIGTADGTYVNTPDLAQTGAIRDGDTAVNFKSASAERGTLTTLGTFGSSIGTCSVAFWVKSTTTNSQAILGFFNAGTATAMQFTANNDGLANIVTGATRFLIRNEAGTATRCGISTNLYDGNWHFVVAVTDSTAGWIIYVDGYPVTTSLSSGTAAGTYANLGVAMDIAARNNNGTHGSQMNGALDEVAFFPTRLAADDIRSLWGEGAIRSSYGSTQTSGAHYTAVQALTPKLYWRLDEPNATYYAKDISGNGNDGFYLGSDTAFGVDGRVDSANDSFRMTSHDGFGVVRALSYAPFTPGGKITVCGVSRTDAIAAARYQNLFSSDSAGSPSPALEGLNALSGGGDTIRFYADVANDFPILNSTDWDDADPPGAAWFHWAFTFDDSLTSGSAAAKVYINGVEKTPSIGGSTWAKHFKTGLGSGRFQVGNRAEGINGNQENFQGEHDEIAVWDRILSLSEIRGLTAAANIAFFDSGTAIVSLTLTRSEGFYGAVDGPRTVTAAVTPTQTAEHLTGTDSRSITIPITLNASESWSHFPEFAFDDAGSVTVSLTPAGTGSETHAASGSATVAISPAVSAEAGGFADARTATVVWFLTGSGVTLYPDAQSASVALTPAGSESYGYVGAGTATVPVTPTGSGTGFNDSGVVTVPITLFGTVFVDSGTVAVPVTPTGSAPATTFELTNLFGSEPGRLERAESGHMEVATAGRTS